MDVILSGRRLTAREALAAGLVARVVAKEAWLDEAKRVAREIATKGPVATRLAKEQVEPRLRGPAHARPRAGAARALPRVRVGGREGGPDGLRREAPARVQGQVAAAEPALGRFLEAPRLRTREDDEDQARDLAGALSRPRLRRRDRRGRAHPECRPHRGGSARYLALFLPGRLGVGPASRSTPRVSTPTTWPTDCWFCSGCSPSQAWPAQSPDAFHGGPEQLRRRVRRRTPGPDRALRAGLQERRSCARPGRVVHLHVRHRGRRLVDLACAAGAVEIRPVGRRSRLRARRSDSGLADDPRRSGSSRGTFRSASGC